MAGVAEWVGRRVSAEKMLARMSQETVEITLAKPNRLSHTSTFIRRDNRCDDVSDA